MFEAARKQQSNVAPLKDVCTPETVSQLILSLIEGADMVTGQTVVIDGGVGISG